MSGTVFGSDLSGIKDAADWKLALGSHSETLWLIFVAFETKPEGFFSMYFGRVFLLDFLLEV